MNAILILASIILALIIAEFVLTDVILRLNGQPNRSLALPGVSAEPHTEIGGVKINSQGFTGQVFDKNKPVNIKRIAAPGGSVMFNR